MTQQEIINSTGTKTEKAKKLFDLGLTKRQVADLLMNGNVGFAYNVWKKWNEGQNANIINLPFDFSFTRTFGVEIEFYGATTNNLVRELRSVDIEVQAESYNHTTRPHWKITSDSSVRGENGGELVSPVLQGLEGMEELKKVCIALKRAGAKVNQSCGLHIHIGANDLTLDNFKNLYKGYINTESEIDSIMPVSRRANNNFYCKKVISLKGTKEKTLQAINRAATLAEFQNIFTTRYVKLNFQSYQRYGTVEFRQHSGSTTFSKIKNWILICARMVEYAKQNRIASNLQQITNENLYDYIEDRKVDLSA